MSNVKLQVCGPKLYTLYSLSTLLFIPPTFLQTNLTLFLHFFFGAPSSIAARRRCPPSCFLLPLPLPPSSPTLHFRFLKLMRSCAIACRPRWHSYGASSLDPSSARPGLATDGYGCGLRYTVEGARNPRIGTGRAGYSGNGCVRGDSRRFESPVGVSDTGEPSLALRRLSPNTRGPGSRWFEVRVVTVGFWGG